MTRRSLTHALEVSPEKLAFIHGKTPRGEHTTTREVVLNAPTAFETDEAQPQNAVLADNAEAAAKRSPGRPRVPRRTATAGDHADPDDRPSLLGDVLLPITTRLRPETLDNLRRAYLEQKLRRARPATQQEIMDAALGEWLKKHGYA